jgi:DNA-directed RNA polymerase subunit RPC12/RpoP
MTASGPFPDIRLVYKCAWCGMIVETWATWDPTECDGGDNRL